MVLSYREMEKCEIENARGNGAERGDDRIR